MAALAGLVGAGEVRAETVTIVPMASSGPSRASATDIPYYKINVAKYDYTYAWEERHGRRSASFYWDGTLFCRTPSGWNGPGAYETGTRERRGQGWDGGYPWQGPGTAADHDGDESFAIDQVNYSREFGKGPFCGPHRYHHRRHSVLLRRKD